MLFFTLQLLKNKKFLKNIQFCVKKVQILVKNVISHNLLLFARFLNILCYNYIRKGDVMNFNIRGSKLKVTPAIKEYIEEKIGRLSRYLEKSDEVTANVVIRIRGNDMVVEVTMPVKKAVLRAEENHLDLYAAIDLVSEKLENQIRKNKTRMHKKINHEVLKNFKMDTELFAPSHVDEDNKIVKRKLMEMKPMGEEEAILQMDLIGHDFFVYHDIKADSVCVIYRRKDKDYGVIITK